jgi:peptidoglycan/LPS O-acetylase OafA/YrhL
MTTQADSQRHHYDALDGLRGLAILLILFYHNFQFIPLSEWGWVGVDLFFVLSGFLITEILLTAKNQKHYLRNFYIRRGLRILPVYYLCIVLFFFVAPHLYKLEYQYEFYKTHQVFLWTNTQNWLYIFFEKPEPELFFNHCWSLSVEEQFYLCWPLIVFTVKNIRVLIKLTWLFLTGCILSRIAAVMIFNDSDTLYNFQFMTRMDGLAIGCLVALWKFHSPTLLRRNIIRLALLVIGFHFIAFVTIVFTNSSIPHFRFLGYTSISAFFGCILYIGIAKKSWLNTIWLENKVLMWFGKISYSLYLYHIPIFVFLKIYAPEITGFLGLDSNTDYITLSILAALIAIVVSWFSFHFFEKKISMLKGKFPL